MRSKILIVAFLATFAAVGLWADAQPPVVRAVEADNRVVSSITLPDGEQVITAPFVVSDADAVVISGGKNTRVVYRGPPTKGMFQFARAAWCELRDIEIVVESPGVDAAVLVANLPGTSGVGRVSTGNVFTNVRVMHAGSKHAAKKAFSIDSYALGGGRDNNENHTFDRCFAHSYTESGFHVRGHQSMNHLFTRCHAWDGGGRNPVGWWFEECTYFTAKQCGGTRNRADFVFGWPSIKCDIDGFDSEHAKQFIVTDRTGAAMLLSARNVRWDGEPKPNVPVMDCYGPGPYDLSGLLLSGLNGETPVLRFRGTLEGDVSVRSLLIQQHGDGPATAAPVQIPATWAAAPFGLRYEWVRINGSRPRSRIVVNGTPVPNGGNH